VPLNNTGFNAAAKPLTENYLSGFCIVRKLGKFLLNLVHECSNKLVMTYIYIYIYSILLSVNQTREPVKEEHEGIPCRGTGAGGTSDSIPIIHHDELFNVTVHS
jgi:hypothetical protein